MRKSFRVLLPVVAASLVMVYASWLATGSTWTFLAPEGLSAYYDSQARALLDGRWDVDCDSIGVDALVVDGRCYSFVGPAPALLRIPLVLLFPDHDGNWGRLSLLAATLLAFLFVYRASFLLLGLQGSPGDGSQPRRTAWATAYATMSIVCTTQVFLVNTPFLYHEYNAWAAAFSYGSLYLLVRHLAGSPVRDLYGAWLLSLTAVQTRTNVGVGSLAAVLGVSLLLGLQAVPVLRRPVDALLAAFGLRQSGPSSGGHYLMVLLLGLLAAGSPFLVALAKWGSTTLVPLNLHIGMIRDPLKLERIGGTLFHPSNFLFCLKHYFTVFSMQSLDVFPYFRLGPWNWGVERGRVFLDQGEPFLSLPVTMPLFLLLSAAGVVATVRRREYAPLRLPLLGALLGGLTILVIAAIAHRYTHDFWVFLVLSGAIGWALLYHAGTRWRRLLLPLVILLAIWGAFVNFGATLSHIFINRDWADWTLRTRDRLDGRPAETAALPVPDDPLGFPAANPWRTGVLDTPPRDMVMLPWNRGLHPGAKLVFAGSGELTILRVNLEKLGNRDVLRTQVNGPLDPERDGAPHPIRYRAWPEAPPGRYYGEIIQ